jgi:hypothetical protein
MADVKYTADFSQIKQELDEVNAKVDRLRESLDKTAKKFGDQSPQATMVRNAFDRASAELDKKIQKLEKLNFGVTREVAQPGITPGTAGGDPATNRDLEIRFKRESLKYYRDFRNTFGHTATGMQKLLIGGPSAMAQGQGLTGFQEGLRFISAAMIASGGKQFITSFMTGAAMASANKATIGSAVRKVTAGEAIAGAEAGTVSATEEAVSVGAGLGIVKAFAALPPPVQLAIGAVTGILAAGIGGMMFATSDVYKRGRRAGGFGTSVGEMTAFEDTMGRFVNPDDMLKASQQAMYDISSPAYTAMKIAGINPEQWQDPAKLAEGTLAEVQRELKNFKGNRETVLTQAHARGFQNLGLDDESLIRLYRGDQKDVNDLLRKAQKAAPGLNITDDQIKRFDDLTTDVTLLGDKFKTLEEDAMTPLISSFENTVSVIGGVDTELGKFKDWLDKLMGLTTDSNPDIPAPGVLPFSFEQGGFGGKFGIPGSGAPGSIKSRMTQKGQINFPAGGARGKGSAGFGLWASDIGLVASKGLPPEEAAFLDTLGTGETPKGSYSNRSGDPGGLGGRYQFLLSTWNKEAVKVGVNPHDFSPENQDKVAWFYASEEVKRRTGHDLMALLKSGPEGQREAISALSPGIWNAITNIDTDKRGHSGALQLYSKKLHDEMNKVGPTSMNDMRNFQTSSKLAMTIHNAAGANYAVHGAMLGSGAGNYGSYS